MSERIERLIIARKNVFGDFSRCKNCNVNFTAFDNCIICQLVIEKEEKLGRKLTKNKIFNIIMEFD